MSYSQVKEMDTALAERALEHNDGIPIPSHIDPTLPVVFATDSIDFLEETVTGANTTHSTISIVVQCTAATVAQKPELICQRHSTKRRRSLRTPAV